GHADFRSAAAMHADLARRGAADVDHTAAAKWAPIVDAYDDALAVCGVGNPHPTAEGEGAMRGSELVGVEALAARGAVAGELIAVIARHSAAHFGAVVPRNLLLRSDRDRKQKRQGHDREPAHISLPLSGGRHEAASGQGRKPPAPRWAETAASRFGDQTSRLATDSAFVWMKSRRGSTSSPINRS